MRSTASSISSSNCGITVLLLSDDKNSLGSAGVSSQRRAPSRRASVIVVRRWLTRASNCWNSSRGMRTETVLGRSSSDWYVKGLPVLVPAMVCAPSVLAYYGKLPYYSIRLGRRDGKARVTHRGQGGALHRERGFRLELATVPAVALAQVGGELFPFAELAALPPGLVVAVATAGRAPRGPRGIAAKIAPVQIGIAIPTAAAFHAGLWAGGGGEGDTPPSPGYAAPSRTTVYPPPRPSRSQGRPIWHPAGHGESATAGVRRASALPGPALAHGKKRRPAAGPAVDSGQHCSSRRRCGAEGAVARWKARRAPPQFAW